MENYGSNLSPLLRQMALSHRPASGELNFKQICQLANLAGYRVRGTSLSDFLLYSINGGDEDIDQKVGIQKGLRINWTPDLINRHDEGLTYSPSLEPLVPETTLKPTPFMLKNLERHLPEIGIKFDKVYPWPEGERVVMIPFELRQKDNPVWFMFLSEFRKQFYNLYINLPKFFEEE